MVRRRYLVSIRHAVMPIEALKFVHVIKRFLHSNKSVVVKASQSSCLTKLETFPYGRFIMVSDNYRV
jgi:hypothetical protein